MATESLATRPLPQDLDTERAILGAILVNNDLLTQISDKLAPEDFSLEGHYHIFGAMRRLYQNNQPVDELTVKNLLDGQGIKEPVSLGYLNSLTDGFPRLDNVMHYVDILREKSILRRLIQVSQSILDQSYGQNRTALDVLKSAETWIFDISQSFIKQNYITLSDALAAAYGHLTQLYHDKRSITGIGTGFTKLDQLTCGLQRGDLVIIAARPSVGKTSLALNIGLHAATDGNASVALFSLEMSARQLALRLLASTAAIDGQKFRTGFFSKEDWERLGHAAGELDKARIYIDDSASLSLLELQTKARRIKKEHGLDMIVIDYLQLLTGDRRYDNRVQEISAISRQLKALAKEMDVPVIALSQLSRAPETRKGDHKPILADLRESGSIEQDADVVAFIYRDDMYNKDDPQMKGVAEIIVAKQRNGPTDSVFLAFQEQFSRFANLDYSIFKPTET